MQSIFREYDIRGIFEKELTQKSVTAIGYYFGLEMKQRCPHLSTPHTCVVGYDARTHSPVLFQWLADGLMNAGVNVLSMGLVPTGVNYFSIFQEWDGLKASGSIMITGSHNPPEYNGFKMTIDSLPFFGEQITALGQHIMNNPEDLCLTPCEEGCQGALKVIDANSAYVERLAKEFVALKAFKETIAIDCGNGAAGVVLRRILDALALRADILFEDPDGTFPNHHPDPSEEHNLEDLKHLMREKNYSLGFAFDGDADRIAVLTSKNNLKGDQIAVIFGRAFAKEGLKPTIIGEVKCSQTMYDEIDRLGQAIMYKTGHSNLKVKLKETQAHMAAEVSGHLFFNDRWYGVDDAIYAMLRVLELVAQGWDLDHEVATIPPVVSTEEIKVAVTETTKFPIVESIKEMLKNPPHNFPKVYDVITIDGVRVKFAKGWGLVRASNTTPVLVTRYEALTQEDCALYENAMKGLIEQAKKGISVI